MTRGRSPDWQAHLPTSWRLRVPAAMLFLLLVLPPFALVLRAVTAGAKWAEVVDYPMVQAIGLSLATTAASAVIVLLFGTPLAFVLARVPFRLRGAVNLLVELPIVLPPVVAGLGLLMAFGQSSPLGLLLDRFGVRLPFTTAAVILAQVFVAAPFFVRTAQVRFAAIPQVLEEAASINGANTWDFFAHVAIPLGRPGILAGLIIGWARALGEFGATLMFAGNLRGRTQTMPLLVYSALERNIDLAIWTGLALLALALVALIVGRWLAKGVSLPADAPG